MRFDRFDYTVWGIILVLVASIVGLVFAGNQKGITSLTAAELVSTKGPFVIQFPQPIQDESFQGLLSFEPEIVGNVFVRGDQLLFIPQQAFLPGENYTATLAAGTIVQDGRQVKQDYTWNLTVREPWLVFLGSEDNELYRVPPSGGENTPLTDTGGQIFDYMPSNDGSQIAFAVINEDKGIDIWVMEHDGSSQRMLINCGPDRCSAMDWSPDNSQLAYSRIEASLLLEGPYSAPRVWLADTSTSETLRLHADSQKMGYGPNWSPDGKRLIYSDGVNTRMVVLDIETGTEFYIPNQSGRIGSWSPDGSRLVYSDFLITDAGANEVVYQVDFDTADIINLFGHRPNESNYSGPVWSPTGEWIAAIAKESQSNTQYQLMLMAPDASYGFVLADEPDYAYLNYSFDPTGRYISYQRTPLGISPAIPEILVKDLQSKEIVLLIPGASFPTWLP